MWIWLVLLYGVLKGVREIVKKKALETSTVMEILFLYTLISFLMTIPMAQDAFSMEPKYYGLIIFKSIAVYLAWILSFTAIKKMPISTFGVLDLSRVLFSTFLGIVILHESLNGLQLAGLFFVCTGLLFLPYKGKRAVEASKDGAVRKIYIAAAFLSCMLNALSGTMDKLFMREVTSSQLQFWYMLYMVLFYLIYLVIKKEKIRKSALKNKWIWLLSIMFVIADKALFIANGMPESRVTVMTLLKQIGCIVVILGGRIVFKEKNIRHKLICACIIIFGIFLAALSKTLA